MNTKSVVLHCICLNLLLLSCETDPASIETDNYPAYQWKTASPESQNMDALQLNAAADSALHSGFVHSLLVVRNGFIVAESYFQGHHVQSEHNIKSVSKSFISALVGLAIQKRFILTEYVGIMQYFPEYRTIDFDGRKENIQIVHLLTMRAGLEFDEQDAFQFFSGDNWIGAALELPLVDSPGSSFNYATPLTHLLSALLTRATGTSTLEFARNNLFLPLGIEVKYWTIGPQGYYFGGSEMFFTSRDMARFGYLYLQDGKVEDQQIIESTWINKSFQDYAERENWTWGAFSNIGYGYLWWLGTLGGYDVSFALGYGGQFIILIPDLNMIVVTTCNSQTYDWDLADAQERWVSSLIANYIIPAVID
jgi:CubicO group peptidase (beta-lactamase class C family)